MTLVQEIIIIVLVAIFTMLTRFLPFMIFKANSKIPSFLEYVQSVLPFAIFGLLVIYCLKDINVLSYSYGIPELLGIVIVIVLYLSTKNTLISIFVSTILYMILVQIVF